MRFEIENKLNDYLVSIENEIESRKKQKKSVQTLREKNTFFESPMQSEKKQKPVDLPEPITEPRIDLTQTDINKAVDDDDLAGFINADPWSGPKKKAPVQVAPEDSSSHQLEDPLASLKREEDRRDQQDKSFTATDESTRKFPQVKIQQKKLTPKPKH